MSSEKTSNLKIHRWIPKDSVLRDEWNDNFYVIDQEFGQRGVNIKWKGADSTGIADSSAALLAAINDPSDTVFIPKGVYLISQNVTIPSTERLVFDRNARFKIAAGKTMTISNCAINAQPSDWIFDLTLGGSVIGQPKVEAVFPQWFGAKGDGINDDSNAIIQAITCVSSGTYPGVVVLISGRYKLTKGIEFDVSKCRLEGIGNVELEFTGLTGTRAISLYSSESYNNRYKQLQDALSGVAIIGSTNQSSPLAGKTGLYLGHATYQNNSMFKVRRVSIDGFGNNIEFTHNVWRVCFEHISSRWGKHLVPAGLTNFGENITFYNCAFFDSGAHWEIGSGDFYFQNTSFDNSNIIITGGASVFVNQCHFERPGSNTSSGYRVDIQSSTGLVVLRDCRIVAPSSVVAQYTSALFRVSDTNPKFGLIIRDCRFFSDNRFKPYLEEGSQVMITGSGRALVSGFHSNDNFYNFVFSRSLNVISNGDGEAGNLNGWTKTGSGTAVMDTNNKKYGNFSIKQTAPTSGSGSTLYQDFKVKPQEIVMLQLWWMKSAMVGTANIKVSFLDKLGNVITGTEIYGECNALDWSNRNTSSWAVVPPGSETARLYLTVTNNASTPVDFYVDDIIINVI